MENGQQRLLTGQEIIGLNELVGLQERQRIMSAMDQEQVQYEPDDNRQETGEDEQEEQEDSNSDEDGEVQRILIKEPPTLAEALGIKEEEEPSS